MQFLNSFFLPKRAFNNLIFCSAKGIFFSTNFQEKNLLMIRRVVLNAILTLAGKIGSVFRRKTELNLHF